MTKSIEEGSDGSSLRKELGIETSNRVFGRCRTVRDAKEVARKEQLMHATVQVQVSRTDAKPLAKLNRINRPADSAEPMESQCCRCAFLWQVAALRPASVHSAETTLLFNHALDLNFNFILHFVVIALAIRVLLQ